LARTLAESTLARDQSNRPARPSRSSTSRWSCSNTPALAHSFNRRHAVPCSTLALSSAGYRAC